MQDSRRLQRIGVDIKNEGLGNELSARDVLALGAQADALGFESVWLNEDVGRDSFSLLSAMAMRTSSIGLGTAVVNVYNRSAYQMAMGIATIDELSEGRAVLGFSVGHRPWNDRYHGLPLERPVARAEEYLHMVRKVLSGERFQHDGPIFRGVDAQLGFRPFRQALPIYLGGERPRMIALAGRLADGLIVNVVPLRYIQEVINPRFREAAREADRDAGALELLGIVTCCLADDRAEARALGRAYFLRRFRSQPERMMQVQGEAVRDELSFIKHCLDQGDEARAEASVSDALASSIAAIGTVDDVWESVEAYFRAGCTRVALASYPRGSKPLAELLTALAARRPTGAAHLATGGA